MDTKKLEKWYTVTKQLEALRKYEIKIRKELFKEIFPAPKEGTNTEKIPASDWEIRGTYGYSYKIDESIYAELCSDVKLKKRIMQSVKFKPSLYKQEYDKMPKDDKIVFNKCLTIKPKTPTMRVVLPKK